MKLIRTLYVAAAVSAFAVPAAAQDMTQDPAATPPVAQPTTPPTEQPVTTQPPEAQAPAAPAAATSPVQPGPAATPAEQPTAQTAPAAAAAAAPVTAPTAAVAADLTVGAQVFDQQGQAVGTIETADAAGAVVSTGNARGRLNLDAFYKNERGLLIGYSRAQFEGLVTGMGGPEASDDSAHTPAQAEQPAPATAPEQPEMTNR